MMKDQAAMKQQESKTKTKLRNLGHFRANQHDTHSLMLQLPDELLILIVEQAASRDENQFSPQKRPLVALSRVCHRLRRIAQPILFQNIRAANLLPPSIKLCKLRRTLRDRSDFRKHCKSLYLDLTIPTGGTRDNTWLVANEFADWLTSTTDLCISATFDDWHDDAEAELDYQIMWRLILRIECNFKNLKRLRLHSCRSGSLSAIFKRFKMETLKILEVQNLGVEWREDSIELELKKRRTASFTSLSVATFCERPAALFLLLQWPDVLTRFELGSVYNNTHPLSYPMLESWLRVHQESLKHVAIGRLSCGGTQRPFNATIFPKLEYLRLSRWETQVPLQFTPEDTIVLGPSLKTFVWDFSISDEYGERRGHFGEAEASWMLELAAYAVSSKSALARIELHHEPPECPHYTSGAMEFPWDRMDAARDQMLEQNSLHLSYNKPPISKESWSDLVVKGHCEGGCIAMRAHDAYEEMMEHEVEARLHDATEYSSTDEELARSIWGYEGEDIRKYMIEVPKAQP